MSRPPIQLPRQLGPSSLPPTAPRYRSQVEARPSLLTSPAALKFVRDTLGKVIPARLTAGHDRAETLLYVETQVQEEADTFSARQWEIKPVKATNNAYVDSAAVLLERETCATILMDCH